MKIFFVFLSFISPYLLAAQDSTQITFLFQPNYGGEAIFFQQENPITDSIQLEELKFYATNFKLLNDEEVVFQESHSYHLVDWQDTASLIIQLTIPTELPYNQVTFDLGVDSITHILGAFGGDLDPMHGMYWTWQSGYINFKLEGTSPSCPARNNRFQFHIGGYQHPFASMRRIRLPISAENIQRISIDVAPIFGQIDLQKTFKLMRPGEEAAAFADLLAIIFSN